MTTQLHLRRDNRSYTEHEKHVYKFIRPKKKVQEKISCLNFKTYEGPCEKYSRLQASLFTQMHTEKEVKRKKKLRKESMKTHNQICH